MVSARARNGFLAALVMLIGGAAAYALLVSKPKPEAVPPRSFGPPVVEVVSAEPGERALAVTTQGTVRPLRQIKLMSQVGGRVVDVSPHFAQGGFFASNEVLVQIEGVDYQLQIARAESQVAGAKQTLAEEKGRARQAKREWRDLGSTEANDLFLRKPQINAATAALEAAEADLEAAELDLARTAVSAPFNGRVSEKLVDVGQFVGPGTHVATVYATDAVEVRLPLTGRQVALLDLPLNYDDNRQSVDTGAPVTLRAPFANREWEWHGRLVRTDASIDENSRLVYAVAEVEKPFARDVASGRPPLSPGLFVNATITGRVLPQVSQLPRSALRNDGSIMVVDAQQRARQRQVHMLDSQGGQIWVQGLEQGERVIVRQPPRLVTGMEVQVKTVAELAGGGG